MHQFSQRVLDYQDARLNPLCETELCPTCKARAARRRFEQAVRDAAAHEIGPDEAKDMLGTDNEKGKSPNVFGDFLDAMADWIEDTVDVETKDGGGMYCTDHTWMPDDF